MTPQIMCTLTANQILGCRSLLSQMYAAGMRAVRINTAHLTGIDQLALLARTLKQEMPGITILIDTKGPEMRTTAIGADIALTLEPGMTVGIEGTHADLPTTLQTIYVNYADIHREVQPGDVLLIDDGTIALTVQHVDGRRISATVSRGGALGSRKGLSVSGKDVALPAVSDHDRQYIAYAAQSDDIDVVAHSFVRSADDVLAVRHTMGPSARCLKPIIAKIENQQGIDNLPGIIAAANGILIARGDLTASIGRDNIPAAQQHIATATKGTGKPLYLATNILPSMMHSTVPSAEDAQGIATAQRQGVDVMLLTNETAAGEYPAQTVAALYEFLNS